MKYKAEVKYADFCPNCGKKIEPDTKFCPSCGANIASYSSIPVIGNSHVDSEKNDAQYNKTWNKIYHQSLNGDVSVEHYQHYDNDGVTMKATEGNSLYVVNGRGGYTTDKNNKNSQSHLVISDGRHN